MISRRTLRRGAPAALALPQVAPLALAQAMNLRMQRFLGTNSALDRVTTRMAEEVQQATGGRVQLQVLPGGAVVAPTGLLDTVRGGEIVVLGLVARPQLLRLGHDRRLAIGTICAAGSLGTVIPPSVILVFYGLTANVGIGDLFLATLLPGLMVAALYVGYVLFRCRRDQGHGAFLRRPGGDCAHLTERDWIITHHRGHGHCIAKGAGMARMMAELMGRETGYCRGLGGSMHIADLPLGILGANGVVGAGAGIGLGAALAARLADFAVGIAFFGDGAANEGIVHEAMNLAAPLAPADGVPVREQPLRPLDPVEREHRGRPRRARRRLRHAGRHDRRQ